MGVGASVPSPTVCAHCQKRDGDNSVNLRVCSGCEVVLYCSRTCQRQHWVAGHKHECESASKRVAAAEAAAFEAVCDHATAPTCARAKMSKKNRFYGLLARYKSVPQNKFDAWASVKVRVGFRLKNYSLNAACSLRDLRSLTGQHSFFSHR
jgi:hypothetical protein